MAKWEQREDEKSTEWPEIHAAHKQKKSRKFMVRNEEPNSLFE